MITTRGVSPTLVATLRGLVYAVVIGVGTAAVGFAGGIDADDLGQYAWALPFLGLGARAVEGFVDKLRGQAPQQPGGSKPADVHAYADGIAGQFATLEVAAQEPPIVVNILGSTNRVDAQAVAHAVAEAMPRSQAGTRQRVVAAVLAVVGGASF